MNDPYFWHVLAVSKMGKTDEEQIVGALHDVLEDCTDYWKKQVEFFCWPDENGALLVLSRIDQKGNKKNDDVYYSEIKTNPLALAVKKNDITHNTSPERMNKLLLFEIVRLNEKYRKAKIALGL